MIILSINASPLNGHRSYEWKFHRGAGSMSRAWAFLGRPYELELLAKACDGLSSASLPQEFSELTIKFQDDGGKTTVIERKRNKDQASLHSQVREAWENGVGLASFDLAFATRHFVVQEGNPLFAYLADQVSGDRKLAREWIDAELKLSLVRVQNLCQTTEPPPLATLKRLIRELSPLRSQLGLLEEHYGKYLHNKNTLGSLPKKRNKLRDEVTALEKTEAMLLSIETQSKLLLTDEEEQRIRLRVTKNLKDCRLETPPSVADLSSWNDLIRSLGEIECGEKIIQLSRYGLQYFELLWYSQILSEDQRIKTHMTKVLTTLSGLLTDGQERESRGDMSAEKILLLAEKAVAGKAARSKKLERLDHRIAQLTLRHEIRMELGQRKKEALEHWTRLWSEAKLTPIRYGSTECEEFFEHGQAILSLAHLKSKCAETTGFFPFESAPAHFCTWTIDPASWDEKSRDLLTRKVDKVPTKYLNLLLTGDSDFYNVLRKRSIGWVEQNLKHQTSPSHEIPSTIEPSGAKKGRGEKIVDLLNGNRI